MRNRTTIRTGSRAPLRRLAPLPAALLLAALRFGSGCSDATGPGTPGPAVTFAPAADTVRATLGSTVNFTVTVANLADPQILFVREDVIVGTTANLPYQATTGGVDHLRAIVTGGGRTWERAWTIIVGDIDRPPVVLNLVVADGMAPSTVLVSWRRPSDVSWPLPLVEYQVAARTGTPPTQDGWESQRFASLPVGGPAESHEYGPVECPLILPDAVLYIGVRTVDEDGALSPITVAGPWRVTRSWEIVGVLRDDRGQPLGSKSIAYNLEQGCETCRIFTAADGSFRLGPLRERDTYFLLTRVGALYYNFLTPAVTIETAMPLNLAVIERRTLSPGCAELAYPGPDGPFELLLDLSKTDQTWDGRPDSTLQKWDVYPVPIYVPEGRTGSGGFDLGLAARAAVQSWNERVGQPVLQLVPAPPALGIEVVFENLAPLLGLAELLDPPQSAINEVPPRKILVHVEEDLNNADLARGIAMHELGHALGLGGHSHCMSHLMTDAFTQGLEITDDEVAAMRAVRNLPQATAMNRYLR